MKRSVSVAAAEPMESRPARAVSPVETSSRRGSSQRHLRAFVDVLRGLSANPGVPEFLGQLSQTIAALTRAEKAAFWTLQPDGTIAVERNAYGFSEEELSFMRDVPCSPDGTNVPDEIVFRDMVVNAPMEGDAYKPYRARLDGMGVRTSLTVSWRAGTDPLGALSVYDSTRVGGFTAEDVWLLQAAGQAAALAWEHAKSTAALEHRVSELGHLLDASATLGALVDEHAILERVGSLAVELLSPAGPISAGVTLVSAAEASSLDRDRAACLAGRRTVRGAGRLVTPIFVGTQPVAVLTIEGVPNELRDERSVRLMDGIAGIAGLAIANTRRHALETQREQERRELAAKMALLEDVRVRFMKLASHELRTPVTIIGGYLSLFEDGSIGADRLAAVLPVLRLQHEQLQVLVEGLLQTARLEADRVTMRIEPLDLRGLASRVVASLEVLPKPTVDPRLRIRIEAGEPDIRVLGDRRMVERILGHLLTNACTHGLGAVVVGLEPDGHGAGRLLVTDGGPGLAGDALSMLFDPFLRAAGGERGVAPGAGLGLYLSRELAHMMGGEIQVSSEDRLGSTFTLTLPLAEDPVGRRQPRRSPERRAAAGKQRLPPDLEPAAVGGLIAGEDPKTSRAADARHWVAIYRELVEVTQEALERLIRAGAPVTDRLILEKELRHLQGRLNLWHANHWQLQGLAYDEAGQTLTYRGVTARLTGREYQLLALLMAHEGRWFTPQEIVLQAWHDSRLPFEQVRNYVVRLRRRLLEIGIPCRIQNQPRRGYALTFGDAGT